MSKRLLAAGMAWVAVAPASGLAVQTGPAAAGSARMEARIWLDRGVDPVLQQGDRVRVYYRASEDAYLAVFHVDTDGVLRLVLPTGRAEGAYRVRGGSDYRLLPAEADGWRVDGDPGVGYFFVLASEVPFDFDGLGASRGSDQWEVSRAGVRIDQDPYVAVDGLTRLLAPDAARTDVALDFTAYHVGQTFSYPRFICNQCHEPQPFAAWNPYQNVCSTVRVVIYNDPYFYPVTRYQGTRVVYPRPPMPGLAQFAFRERLRGEAGTPDVRARVGPAAPDVLPPEWMGRSADARVEMLELLDLAGALAPGFGADPRANPVAGPRPGAPPPGSADPRVLGTGTTPDDRPVMQRRVNQQGDPQPRR